jgi:hypothetical protein
VAVRNTNIEITAIQKQQWIPSGIVFERLYGDLMSPATMESTWLFM